MKLGDYPFTFISPVDPDRDAEGDIVEVTPPGETDDGPALCRFRVPGVQLGGVFALCTVKEEVKYVGECESLDRRFNHGIGQIDRAEGREDPPGEWKRINRRILEATRSPKLTDNINLHFYATREREQVARELTQKFKPPWNDPSGGDPKDAAGG